MHERNMAVVSARSAENAEKHKKERVPVDLSFLEGQEVYMYSGQKLQSSELQLAYMRSTIQPDNTKNLYSYSDYNSGAFPVVDTSAPVPKIRKGPVKDWKFPQPRQPSDFRKLDHDLDDARKHELSLPWDEPPDPFRSGHGTERVAGDPFAARNVVAPGGEFGPSAMFQSVHSSGAEVLQQMREDNNAAAQAALDGCIIKNPTRAPAVVNSGSTRNQAGDLDRIAPLLEGKPEKLGISFSARKPPKSLTQKFGKDRRVTHDVENPKTNTIVEKYDPAATCFQARLRANDVGATFNVAGDTYAARPRETYCDKTTVGSVQAAPWQHTFRDGMKDTFFVAKRNFDNLSPPPRSAVFKNAARAEITAADKSGKFKMSWKQPQSAR
mmetsp:Transcript_75743/g.202656  ORF Transcript_75743/g.202656 Transcript_75743/m.202656 type:complete len:382 (-) Transcript_75743:289-1434(-)